MIWAQDRWAVGGQAIESLEIELPQSVGDGTSDTAKPGLQLSCAVSIHGRDVTSDLAQ